MPLNSRDLWLVLKAQDQTNRALNTFGRNVRNAGNQVRAAQLEAQRAAALGAVTQARLNMETERAAVAQLLAQKATNSHTIAQKQAAGAAASEIQALQSQNQKIDDEVRARRGNIAAIQGTLAQRNRELVTVKDNITQNNAYNKSIQDQEKNLSHLSGRLQSVSQTATAAGFAFSAAGILMFVGLKKAIDTSVEYERQVRATATQVEGFSGNLEELGDIGRRVARDIAVPFEQIQPALFDVFSSMDVSVKEAEGLLRSFSKAAVAGQTDIQSVSRATIGILNAFSLPASDVNKILDIQFKLVQKGIGTYEEWNQRIGLVTPSAVRAGQSIEQMVAALAASTRMGVSAARSGTAVARAFDALSNPAAVKSLKALGVNVQDAQGKFRPFNEVLRDFRTVLMKMPEKDRLAAILDVFKGAGGTIEARRFLQNMLLGKNSLELFDQILGQVSDSSGAMEQAYGIMANSAAAKSQLLRNQWDLLKEGLGRALIPAFTTLVTWVGNAIKAFNGLPDSTKKTIAIFLVVAAVFSTVVGLLFLVIGAIGAVVAAFVVAGGALVATLGVLAAVGVALGALTAAFLLAYKRSSEFRVLLGQLIDYFKQFSRVVAETARAATDAFDKRLRKPLENLSDLISSKIIPAFTAWMNFVVSKVMPKVREAGRILVDIFGAALHWIGTVIQNVVVPALARAVEWWNKNQDTLRPLIAILAQVVKWVIIIGAVLIGILVAALVGPVIAAFIAAAVVIGLLVAAIVYVIKFIKFLQEKMMDFAGWVAGGFVSLWNTVSSAFITAWNAIVDFFVAIWNAIVSAVTTAWGAITNAFSVAMAFIGAMWADFWNSRIGQLVMSVWNFIVAVVKLGAAAIQFIVMWALVGISAAWTATWNGIKGFFSGIWDAILYLQRGAMNIFLSIWNTVWPAVSGFFRGIWNGIRDYFVGLWSMIVAFVRDKANQVSGAISSAWNFIRAATATIWAGLVGLIATPLASAAARVAGWIGTIKGFFSGAGTWLYNAGKAIVQGLIDGITHMFDQLTAAANRLAGIIKDHLPGSPVKRGPLKVLNHGYAGKTITRMIAQGLTADLSVLRNSAVQMANTVANNYESPMPGPSNQWGGAASKVYNINQTINTQEISPVRQAAQLGWEVTTVM